MHSGEGLKALPSATIRLIGSSQVITSVYSVIKELLENSLDANASCVDIKLDEYGLQKIEVSDNGCGVKAGNVPFMVKRHFTSKLVNVEDLATLETYGFRGEALASLCAVSALTITTKSDEEVIGHIYTFGNDGNVLEEKPSHVSKGTIICAKKLFSNLPVRKQYYSSDQRKKDDLKKIENLIMAYSIIKPSLRITLKHEKVTVFQKTAFKDTRQVLHHVFGRHVAHQLIQREKTVEDPKLSISAFLPKPGADIKEMSLSSTDKLFLFVNERPVFLPELNRILRSYYSNCHDLDNSRFPICIVSISLPLDEVDVNVDPNKTKVFLQHKTEVKTCLEEILLEVYGPLDNVPSWHYIENDSHNETAISHVKCSKEGHLQKAHSIMYKSLPDDSVTPGDKTSGKDIQLEDESEAKESSGETNVSVDVIVVPEMPSTSNSHQSERFAEDGLESCLGEKTDSHKMVDIENNEIDIPKDNETEDSAMSLPADTTRLLEKESICHENLPINEERAQLIAHQQAASDISNSNKNVQNVETEIDMRCTEASSWTRGVINVDGNMSTLQPVKLLPPSVNHNPGKRSLTEDQSFTSHPAKRKSLGQRPPSPSQSTLVEIFNAQTVKKPDSAFGLFCKEKRSQNENNTEHESTDGTLKNDWENLDDSEKVKYRENCWNETKRYEKELKLAANKNKSKEVKSARDEIASMASQSQVQKPKKILKSRLYSKELVIPSALSELKSLFISNENDNIVGSKSQAYVIGHARMCDAWFCCMKDKVYLINTHRLLELDIYNKLKAEHILPSKLCEPVSLNSRVLDAELLETLEKLAKASQTKDMYFMINDKRLIANGFKVKCHFDMNGSLQMELLEICNMVPTYNIKDMKFVLEILSQNPDAQIQETRPSKVQYYLQGEAVRMMRQNKSCMTQEDVQQLLNRCLTFQDQTCLHDKPILHELISFSENDLDEML